MERIKLDMSFADVIATMAGGNPGAITVCMLLFKNEGQIDPDSVLAPLANILSLDTLGIYEHRIWMLYKDVCGQDLIKMIGVLRANQLGFVSADAVNLAIDNNGQGIDVDDLLNQVQKRLPKFGKIKAEAKDV